MPFKLDNIPIGRENDGRRRITDEQKLEMHTQYKNGVSINQIARNIGCSKRSVQFELFPERKRVMVQHMISAKRWEAYNDKDTRREVMRKHRAKKKRLFKEGKITIPRGKLTF
jgi:transposase-like protein